ncbi:MULTISPECIES: TetR/AcrR family transcriptional regulator [Pseudomonas]|jgi:AcrR family transcriptional regulator|uniref:TetR/AcrR family transcriptional regulator n=1 Tax=Pseudomonas TaxID=286 RepID=UPI0008E7AE51|nr:MULTISPECIES: TetR/AcrR family transcriptional regulator [Pseudomonas]QDH65194.1 TetR/AcrR family transcriptional regulator [Pseudomonas azotoformans]SFS27695.1 transcriptional regulator, TetR family [Pseudomonas sp. NFACC42-2]
MAIKKTGVRAQQADQTRSRILQAAVKVFTRDGYSGGRVDTISKEADSNDRMLYYYFGSKEHLFVCVLEHTYEQFNHAESTLKLDLDAPVQALRELVAFIWNYYIKHPEFVAILSIENLHQGKHAKQSGELRRLSGEAVGVLRPIIEAGQAQGVFREDVDLKHVYLMIASLCYFYNSNRHTLSSFLGEDLSNKGQQQDWLGFISDLVVRGVIPLPPL